MTDETERLIEAWHPLVRAAALPDLRDAWEALAVHARTLRDSLVATLAHESALCDERDRLAAVLAEIREAATPAQRSCACTVASGCDAAIRHARLEAALASAPADLAAARDRRALAAAYDQRAAWSLRTFGAGDKYAGVVEHIRRELAEIERDPADLEEWVDVVMLAMDGAWRSAGADGAAFWAAFRAKAAKNEARQWAPPDAQGVVEHVRSPLACGDPCEGCGQPATGLDPDGVPLCDTCGGLHDGDEEQP